MLKKLGKKYIKMDEDINNEVSEEVEDKEEKKMGFFAKHKKGLIIGGLGALAAGAVGLLIAKKGSDDDYEDDYDLDDVDETDEDSSAESSED